MISFSVTHTSDKSNARRGVLLTPHGEVQTPAFIPVATQATIKALPTFLLEETTTQMIIANTYHLHLRPGETIIQNHGGIHSFMGWDHPIMTDSGGFQVFSLGFGKDFHSQKMTSQPSYDQVREGAQPKLLTIGEDGVTFTSYIDGKELFLGPQESITIQEQIGADIMFAFDECPPPFANHAYVKTSLQKTHRWAQRSLDARTGTNALYGIIQGGRYKDLREESAQYITSLPFDGFGIGGEFGSKKEDMTAMLSSIHPFLPPQKPRHLLGVGHLEDIPLIIKEGVDTFDCIVPTHYARHGYAFTSQGKLDIRKRIYQDSQEPLDPSCSCSVCSHYSAGYIHHLLRSHEIAALSLLTFHNIYYFHSYVADLRTQIEEGKL